MTFRHPWAMILAGGNGERIRPVVERWLGRPRPKQYCAFVGTRTMLEHTWDRALQIVDPDRMITIIGPGHLEHLKSAVRSKIPGRVLEQPLNKDTGVGIFIPAAHILSENPKATVFIFPSDHFVFPEEHFLDQVTRAGLFAEEFKDKLILLGAAPTGPDPDYGWIQPGEPGPKWKWSARESLRTVVAFKEKPDPEEARQFLKTGCLWNTLVIAVKIAFLWGLGCQFLPELMERVEIYRRRLSTPGGPIESHTLSAVYAGLDPINFSARLLEPAVKDILVFPLREVEWSDWGRADRITETLVRIGRVPAFH